LNSNACHAAPAAQLSVLEQVARVDPYYAASNKLRSWIEMQHYAGYEPYDLLNSPYLRGRFLQLRFVAPWIIQLGRRLGGLRLRRWLKVAPSKNPKALALCLSAYCDLAQQGFGGRSESLALKAELLHLKSPGEQCYSWGYDWPFVSLRGAVLPKFSPNCIATCFVANALLDMGDTFRDEEAVAMACSAGEFITTRLIRSVESPQDLCFSYTPARATVIYNNSAIAGALLARLGAIDRRTEYFDLARRSMQFLADRQNCDGSWYYGAGRWQRWIDSFHTGYNLCALLEYQRNTADAPFERQIQAGYDFYKTSFFRHDGAPKYYHDRVYPIDIHCCSQAILTFCAFRDRDPDAAALACRSANWALQNMRGEDGTFFYQRRHLWTDRTPYMRWGQSWMFRALTRLEQVLAESERS
jgi:hypothetical protein